MDEKQKKLLLKVLVSWDGWWTDERRSATDEELEEVRELQKLVRNF
jgi:hypothetical protein